MAQYKAFLGSVAEGGKFLMAFKPPIELTQGMVNEALGSNVSRITVEGPKLSVPEVSAFTMTVAEPEASFMLTPKLQELGRRICDLASATDIDKDTRANQVSVFQQRPYVQLILPAR